MKPSIVSSQQTKSRKKSYMPPSDMPYSGEGPVNLQLGGVPTNETPQRRVRASEQPRESAQKEKLYAGTNYGRREFDKVDLDPSLFKLNIQRKHLEHLQNDDLDEMSRYEVIYKILKDQLRTHQKKIIEMKEE